MSLRLLEKLTRNWKPGWSMVDLGTGSGILALVAKCFGATRVIGIDNDPSAISTAKENARLNKISGVDFRGDDVRRCKLPSKSRLRRTGYGGQVDIVTANLFSELLIEIFPKLKAARWLILSGILRGQERELTRAFKRHKIDILQLRRRGKWVAILAAVR
jgi:ribosomal protein L11 methyltransferase